MLRSWYPGARRSWRRLVLVPVVLLAVAALGCSAGSKTPEASIEAGLIQPAELATLLQAPENERPVLLHVGFEPLYHTAAIPGSRFVGPGSKREGIAALKKAIGELPHDRAIVIYCGCCPWGNCPNMKPAFKAARAMGYTNVRALHIAKNFETDWTRQGYPTEKPTD
jgi:hypothetical protein